MTQHYDDIQRAIRQLRETRRKAVQTLLMADNSHNRQVLIELQAALKAAYEIEQDEKTRSQ